MTVGRFVRRIRDFVREIRRSEWRSDGTHIADVELMDTMHEGSCLCGAVAYAIDVAPVDVSHCHCSMCRKAHGAAFATFATVPAENHRFTRGREHVRCHRSSETVERCFCSRCGSPVAWLDSVRFPGVISFPLAGLDGSVRAPSQHHIFVASKASWYDILDDWPQSDGYSEAVTRV